MRQMAVGICNTICKFDESLVVLKVTRRCLFFFVHERAGWGVRESCGEN